MHGHLWCTNCCSYFQMQRHSCMFLFKTSHITIGVSGEGHGHAALKMVGLVQVGLEA